MNIEQNFNKIVMIVNPCAGKRKGQKCSPKIYKQLQNAGKNVSVLNTQKAGDATVLVKNVDDDALIVCVGGDGTLNEVVNGIIKYNKPNCLGYIPMGTTNDFAKSIGISKNYKKAVANILSGEPKIIDACKIGDKYFTYVSACGLFAETSCSTSSKIKNKIGWLAYFLAGARELFRYKKVHLKFEVENGEVYEDDYLLTAVGNTKSIGGILKFKDDVVGLSDGVFELLLVKYPKSIFKLSKTIDRYNKKSWNSDELKLIHSTSVKVYDNKKCVWSVDGEKFSRDDSEFVKIDIVPSALKIMVGKNAIKTVFKKV